MLVNSLSFSVYVRRIRRSAGEVGSMKHRERLYSTTDDLSQSIHHRHLRSAASNSSDRSSRQQRRRDLDETRSDWLAALIGRQIAFTVSPRSRRLPIATSSTSHGPHSTTAASAVTMILSSVVAAVAWKAEKLQPDPPSDDQNLLRTQFP